MKKLYVPSIYKFDNISSFIKNFIEVNKVNNPNFSYRYFAKRIHWPSSYLSDLSKNRKKLSFKKAEELSEHLQLSSLEKERLIWLTLGEKKDLQSKLYVNAQVSKTTDQLLKTPINIQNIQQYHITVEILTILIFSRVKKSAQEILNEFQLPGFSIEEVDTAIQYIKKENLLTWNKKGQLLKINKRIEGFDNNNNKDSSPYQGIEIHTKYAKNFLGFISQPKTPSTYNSGLIEIKKDQFLPIALKILEVRNWLLELSDQNQKEVEAFEPRRLMQFNLDLFTILK